MIEETKVMGEEQNGFRSDRRGEDNMFVVGEIIQHMKRENRKLYMAFLDIEKAYDRVDRSILCSVLSRVGMSTKYVNIIRSMYEETKAIYTLGDIETDWVKCKKRCPTGMCAFPIAVWAIHRGTGSPGKGNGPGSKAG